MEKVYLQWNFVNWITVLAMAALGGATVGFIYAGLKQWNGETDNAE